MYINFVLMQFSASLLLEKVNLNNKIVMYILFFTKIYIPLNVFKYIFTKQNILITLLNYLAILLKNFFIY